jgi:ketosteroid isomerase-like protein
MHRMGVAMVELRSIEERNSAIGAGSVVAFLRQTATGKGSGVPVDQDYAVVYELKGGQLVRMRAYPDRAQALEAAGLSE